MKAPLAVLAAVAASAAGCAGHHRSDPNAKFIARAESICAQASARLEALPKFPFKDFDALDPDPQALPKVGRFLTGPGDELPITRSLARELRALGTPPASTGDWRAVVQTFDDFAGVFEREDAAALRADVDAWVDAVRDNRRLPAALTKATEAFGAQRCAIFE